jgi:hypothetical protein
VSISDANGYIAVAQRTHANASLLARAAAPLEPGHTARDWLTTMHFYIVVAYVNAVAALEERRFPSHDARRAWVRDHPHLRAVAIDYFALDGWSRAARYDGDVRDDLDEVHEAYKRVAASASALLRSAGVKPPSLPPIDFDPSV